MKANTAIQAASSDADSDDCEVTDSDMSNFSEEADNIESLAEVDGDLRGYIGKVVQKSYNTHREVLEKQQQ